MPWSHPDYSIEESRSWLAVHDRRFSSARRSSSRSPRSRRLFGGCGLIDALNQRANLGYWVRSSATGQGVATAAWRSCATGDSPRPTWCGSSARRGGQRCEPSRRGQVGRRLRGHAPQPPAGPRHAPRRCDVRVHSPCLHVPLRDVASACSGIDAGRAQRGARQPQTQAFDVDVIDRRDVERQQLRDEQAADDGQPERAARLGAARAEPQRDRQRADQRRPSSSS